MRVAIILDSRRQKRTWCELWLRVVVVEVEVQTPSEWLIRGWTPSNDVCQPGPCITGTGDVPLMYPRFVNRFTESQVMHHYAMYNIYHEMR